MEVSLYCISKFSDKKSHNTVRSWVVIYECLGFLVLSAPTSSITLLFSPEWKPRSLLAVDPPSLLCLHCPTLKPAEPRCIILGCFSLYHCRIQITCQHADGIFSPALLQTYPGSHLLRRFFTTLCKHHRLLGKSLVRTREWISLGSNMTRKGFYPVTCTRLMHAGS